MICTKCGADAGDFSYCPNCGEEVLSEDKPMEDVNELILKIIDTPSKKLRVVKEDA